MYIFILTKITLKTVSKKFQAAHQYASVWNFRSKKCRQCRKFMQNIPCWIPLAKPCPKCNKRCRITQVKRATINNICCILNLHHVQINDPTTYHRDQAHATFRCCMAVRSWTLISVIQDIYELHVASGRTKLLKWSRCLMALNWEIKPLKGVFFAAAVQCTEMFTVN